MKSVKKKYLTLSFLCSIIAKVIKVSDVEKVLKQSLLYDFYGELLTEHQKSIYEDYVLNDLSLSEIAADRGISRQGVHDLIKRCDNILESYEEKLLLLSKFLEAKKKVNEIHQLANEVMITKDFDAIAKIDSIAQDIMNDL